MPATVDIDEACTSSFSYLQIYILARLCWCQQSILTCSLLSLMCFLLSVMCSLLSVLLWPLERLSAVGVTTVAGGRCSCITLSVNINVFCISVVTTVTIVSDRNVARDSVVLGDSGRFFKRSITSKNSGSRGLIPSSLSSSARRPVRGRSEVTLGSTKYSTVCRLT